MQPVCPKMVDQTLQLGKRWAPRTPGTARSLIAAHDPVRSYAFRPAPAELAVGADAAYSITSLARARIDGGIVSPSDCAVFRFTTSSNVVGCWTGRSAG